METKRRSVAEEAAAKTSEAMERARSGLPELEDSPVPMSLPKHEPRESLLKKHPYETGLGALSLGFLLITLLLPLRSMMRGILRLAWGLFKPAALLYLGAKLAKSSRS